MDIKGCWHVADEDRLRFNLERAACDISPDPRGHAFRIFFGRTAGLEKGDRVRFSCKEGVAGRGKVVATGRITEKPRPRTLYDPPVLHPDYPAIVSISDVEWCEPPGTCDHYRFPRIGSHRLR